MGSDSGQWCGAETVKGLGGVGRNELVKRCLLGEGWFICVWMWRGVDLDGCLVVCRELWAGC